MIISAIFLLVWLWLGRLMECSPAAPLAKRNPCDGKNAKPILYHEYREADCPANFHFLKSGDCQGWHNVANDCNTFCQVRTNFDWTTESPFPKSICHAPIECSISESDSTSVSVSFSFSPKVGKALKLGISGGFSYGTSKANGRSWSFKPNPGECGYFTFVPIRKTTCGTLSETHLIYMGTHADDFICAPVVRTTGNYCVPELWLVNGQPDGTVLFVRINCYNNQPLGPEYQDPVYNLPGVALPNGASMAARYATAEHACKVIERENQDLAFQIRGRGLASGMVGAAGEQLSSQLSSHCGGKLEGYSFQWMPRGEEWEFSVNGTVSGSSATKSCIENAIVAVGGSTKDQCL